MKKFGLQFLIFFGAFLPWLLFAGGEEVVVVYNTRVPESKVVAEHYAQMRQVPKQQIYGFAMATSEEMSREDFVNELQIPLAEKLQEDSLWVFQKINVAATNGFPARTENRVVASKIRYAVLCYGVPLKIAPDPNLHEVTDPRIRPELLRNEASVDSELAWLPLVKMKIQISGPLGNWTYGATNTSLLNATNGLLMVARLDGPTADIANHLVDKAMEAESNGFWGRAYFDTRGISPNDTNYFLGDRWILTGAEICRNLGFETQVDTNGDTFPASFPMSQIAIYAGWYAGDANGPFAQPQVEFMPGAFAYHLHSFSAATLRSTTQNWCGPLLAKGTTCTMGCVYEPYLMATPNVAFFLQAFGNGYTFGEAAWAAQPALSWQTTVVGDPLYRPFGKNPATIHAELSMRHSPLIEWSFLRLVDLDIARGVPVSQLISFIENLPVTTQSAVLSEKLADLCALQGRTDAAIEIYGNALKLNPSPQQRIRLRLTLGEKLQAANRLQNAYDNYQSLLQEAPDYPGKKNIYQTLLTLAQKLGKTEDANRYQTLLK